ncbi:MAG: hypothetical protein K2X43_19295 [Hyphomonadaceae bacterium]|jgi:hypothetical protein|nr:hypothetical protein [Hyphomonadaceae bacterium]
MKRMHGLGAAVAGALALGMVSIAAQAAPLGNAAGGLKATAGENALVQDVRWGRRCWRHRGHWHCRRYGRHYRYYPYYYGGFGPGFGFYFGPRHHRWHHHGWHHHGWHHHHH